MIKRLFIMLFVILTLPVLAKVGENTNYWILSQTDYNLRVSKGKDVILKRFIVVPKMNSDFKTINDSNSDEEILAKYSYMLKKNKSKFLLDYIENCDTKKEINLLIKGLYYFSKKQYSKAIGFLNDFNNPTYEFIKYQLIADCRFELLSNKRDYKKVINDYQTALDIAENDTNKAIINNRIKYIKYR